MLFIFKVWISIRLIVDPGLNYFGMKRNEVLEYFKNYTWDESSMAMNEVKKLNREDLHSMALVCTCLFNPS